MRCFLDRSDCVYSSEPQKLSTILVLKHRAKAWNWHYGVENLRFQLFERRGTVQSYVWGRIHNWGASAEYEIREVPLEQGSGVETWLQISFGAWMVRYPKREATWRNQKWSNQQEELRRFRPIQKSPWHWQQNLRGHKSYHRFKTDAS